jgi:hypothetical protein
MNAAKPFRKRAGRTRKMMWRLLLYDGTSNKRWNMWIRESFFPRFMAQRKGQYPFLHDLD